MCGRYWEQPNANRPKGQVSDGQRTWYITATDQLFTAEQYKPLVITYRNGSPCTVDGCGTGYDSVEDIRTFGIANGKPAVNV